MDVNEVSAGQRQWRLDGVQANGTIIGHHYVHDSVFKYMYGYTSNVIGVKYSPVDYGRARKTGT